MPILVEIVEELAGNDKNIIYIPDSEEIDYDHNTLASLVAKTSNNYGRLARYAGIARAEYKLAKGSFDRKYKQFKVGKNEDEREANAMKNCHEEHDAMIRAEAIAELAEGFEQAARIASESARKLYDKKANMHQAYKREESGSYREVDFG
jgi:hypothetical protein